ncbi:type II toxin-antitoxin system VapC family toxin [Cyclobacterium plantarum]|uniref:Type II toxin-antitoxin system VapC family toxin n=1 Tax=Cyclobacterium plantarum TaxID=2716263 RepID=A0ABX0HGC2_9BACT|nr:type II toxin-antitoxin system VapC family toxin [Cyclobacterium plantarum]NHE59642.1 type II toxin-antitoxin system VapC family toxin [Cyclobacterium plantarum]
MRYLLDTQVLLWIFGESDKLTATATDIVKSKENDLFVSKASFWEAGIKVNIGKLTLPFTLEELVKETLSNDIEILDIEMNHILKNVHIPLYHRDPFDRLIISQAMVEELPIISSGDKFSLYKVSRIW